MGTISPDLVPVERWILVDAVKALVAAQNIPLQQAEDETQPEVNAENARALQALISTLNNWDAYVASANAESSRESFI